MTYQDKPCWMKSVWEEEEEFNYFQPFFYMHTTDFNENHRIGAILSVSFPLLTCCDVSEVTSNLE